MIEPLGQHAQLIDEDAGKAVDSLCDSAVFDALGISSNYFRVESRSELS